MAGTSRVLVVVLAAGGAGSGGGMLAQVSRPAQPPARVSTPRSDGRSLASRADGVARARLDALARRVDERFDGIEKRLAAVASSERPDGAPVGSGQTYSAASGRPAGKSPGATRDPVIALARELESQPYTHRRSQRRYSLAFGDSMAPEFVGLRPRAIKRFEELVQIQDRQAHSDDHALAYMRLGTLYKDAGNAEKARAVWERGRKRHPNNERLGLALELIGKAESDE